MLKIFIKCISFCLYIYFFNIRKNILFILEKLRKIKFLWFSKFSKKYYFFRKRSQNLFLKILQNFLFILEKFPKIVLPFRKVVFLTPTFLSVFVKIIYIIYPRYFVKVGRSICHYFYVFFFCSPSSLLLFSLFSALVCPLFYSLLLFCQSLSYAYSIIYSLSSAQLNSLTISFIYIFVIF